MKIGLVQINNSFSGHHYLPYTAGMLQSYAEQTLDRPEQFEFLPPIYSRLSVDRAVRQMMPADVVCFSTYVWNIRLSLEIARQIKEKNQDAVILFGGPQVPDRSEAFLRKHAFIDLVCNGEGEQFFVSFLNHLERRRAGNWREVQSASFLDLSGSFVQNPRAARLKDLSHLPSPYLSGVFDPLMRDCPGQSWLVLWETNRGCPFSCTFCDWGSAVASKVYPFPMERLQKDMEWFSANKVEFIYCCDANFGILPRDLELVRAMARLKAETGYPKAFSVQNTKNSTERSYQIQKILNDAGLNKGVTLSMQSIDPNTLKQVKRENISLKTYRDLQFRFSADGVHTYTDLILAMPGETYDTFANGVSAVIADGQHNRIQFNNLSILPNAEMGDSEYQKKHGFEVVETKIINVHGSLADTEEIFETQHLVIATNAMDRSAWVRARAFSWMTALLHFDKVLQIPLVLINTFGRISRSAAPSADVSDIGRVGYRDLIEAFTDLPAVDYPILSSIHKFFIEKAKDIQAGGSEYCLSKEWLNIWWPADEYMLIKLCVGGPRCKIDGFYAEVERRLSDVLSTRQVAFPPDLLSNALTLNRHLLKMPFQTEDLTTALDYNVWESYEAAIKGRVVAPRESSQSYRIDRTSQTWDSWDGWYREVIWYENKKGSYLYPCVAIGADMVVEHV